MLQAFSFTINIFPNLFADRQITINPCSDSLDTKYISCYDIEFLAYLLVFVITPIYNLQFLLLCRFDSVYSFDKVHINEGS